MATAAGNDRLTTAALTIVRHLETLILLERDRNEFLKEQVKLQRQALAQQTDMVRTVTLGQMER